MSQKRGTAWNMNDRLPPFGRRAELSAPSVGISLTDQNGVQPNLGERHGAKIGELELHPWIEFSYRANFVDG
jgi:hypothetical protein